MGVFSSNLADEFQFHSKTHRGRDCHLPGMAKGRGRVSGKCVAALLLGGQLEFPQLSRCSSISRAAAVSTPKGYLQVFSHVFLLCRHKLTLSQPWAKGKLCRSNAWPELKNPAEVSARWLLVQGHRPCNPRSTGRRLCRHSLCCVKVYWGKG